MNTLGQFSGLLELAFLVNMRSKMEELEGRQGHVYLDRVGGSTTHKILVW